jgi:hypothetical protein
MSPYLISTNRQDSLPGRQFHNGKEFTVAQSLIIAALDEPEADRLACYSHAARPPENLLYANEANFSGVGVYEQLRFRNKSYNARLRRYRTAGFYFACNLGIVRPDKR